MICGSPPWHPACSTRLLQRIYARQETRRQRPSTLVWAAEAGLSSPVKSLVRFSVAPSLRVALWFPPGPASVLVSAPAPVLVSAPVSHPGPAPVLVFAPAPVLVFALVSVPAPVLVSAP
eukprot:639152-Hanusia_phi.AAC.8